MTLRFYGGKAVPAYGDPGLWHDAIVSRVPGQVIAFKINIADVTKAIEVGLDADKTGELTVHRVRITADTVLYYDGTTAHPICFIPTDGRDYVFVIVLRAAGALFFMKEAEGEYLYLGETTTNTDSGYPGVSNYSAEATVDFIRPCNYRYLPAPVLSDSFTGDTGTNDGRLSDGLGHAETTGIGAGGSGVAWSGASGAVDGSGKLVITPTFGAELNSGDIIVGNWYQITATQANFFYTGCAIGDTFRCATAKTLSADNKVKLITFATCYNKVTLTSKDFDITANFSMTTGKSAGVIIGLNTAGTSFILARHNGAGNVVLEICEAGTYTSKASVAAVYSADAPLRVRRDDREIWVWYNGVLIGTGPTTTLSGLEDANLSGTKAGLFSTSELNSFARVSFRYIGTSGEYSILKRIIGSPYNDAPARVGECMPMGTWGAGVGIATSLPPDMIPMEGTFDRHHPNFGNYLHTPTGSIMVCKPKYYLRIGHPDNPTYAVHGVNSFHVQSIYDFPTTAAANAAGYMLPRAFIDGGVEKDQFFMDKYMASNVAGLVASIKNGNPLSTHADHNPLTGLTGITTNNYATCIDAAKTRGVGFFNASIFQYQACAWLSVAHGQAVTSSERCAWYHSTNNFPKGNNNNALKDSDDTTVIYASDGYSNCGKTGSGVPFAKTTDNGQECGIADLNGNMWEVAIGVTCIATSKNVAGVALENPCRLTINAHGIPDSSVVQISSLGGSTQLNDKIYQITVVDENNITLNGVDATSGIGAWTSGGTVTFGTFYAAKESVAMKDFTSGATAITDHWGATGVAVMMDSIGQPIFRTDYPNNGFGQRWGNVAEQVVDESVSGEAWVRANIGFPKSGLSVSAGGTGLFGKDYFYQYIRNQLCLIVCANWGYGPRAGVFYRAWDSSRTYSSAYVGFRAACY